MRFVSEASEQRLLLARDRLAALDVERGRLRDEIAALEQQVGGPQIATAAGRVALFRELFAGRPDVFATRWESRTQPGRAGWSPRCENEWHPGVCHKPKVKCADCRARRFVAYSDAEVRAHLEGRQTVGIYPLLADETCRLVAIDLDGARWRDDAKALREAAEEHRVPVLVERSRSGDGAHVWVLFDEPVPARTARAIGSWLLTGAMRRRCIGLGSYDRLFPNQDTMPAGGFGNLIALPLQRARREEGCTVFLDDGLEPHADQWSHLAAATRLDRESAAELGQRAERDGGPLGLGARKPADASVPVPRGTRVQATLDGRLHVDIAGIPADLVDQLRRTAAFANPQFHERERARLPTHATPRVIACHEQAADALVLPRGCHDPIQEVLQAAGLGLELDDQRRAGSSIRVSCAAELSAQQRRAVAAMARHDIGVLVAPPGSGKTVMATKLIADRARSALILVHRRPLRDQWIARLEDFLGLDSYEIGSPTEPGRSGIDIATIQTLTRRDDLPDLLDGYGHLVIDECHHASAVSVERVLREAPARYVTGLTATPMRRDGHHPIITMQCGPIRHTLQAPDDEAHARRILVECHTTFDATALPTEPSIQEVLGAVAADTDRTEQIAADVVEQLDAGRYPLVLTERRAHLDQLADRLAPDVARLVVLHGGMGVRARRRADEILADHSSPRVVLATGRYIGEGFDDPRLDTLILAMPIAWTGTMTQYAGRLHRHHDAKHEIRILDYIDIEIPVLRRMYAKRRRAYNCLGYQPARLGAQERLAVAVRAA